MPRSAVAPRLYDLGSPRFEPLGVLGEGGSGIVYETRIDGGDGGRELVALKVLRAELAPSERERRRFLDEAKKMQRVRHPGLVRLLEAGLLPDGRPFLAMPRLDGETLASRLRAGRLPVRTAVRWFGVLARAVHELHRAGIIHRDIKPENVFIEADSPVLLDFGIARDVDDEASSTTTVEGRIRGTPAYMAPERFFGAGASVRSDVYELGVVLYMMLVGRLPWGSEKNVTERLDPKSPEDASPDVSAALARVILRALSTRPELRPPSAEGFALEVERALERDAVSEPRVTADLPVVAASASPAVAAELRLAASPVTETLPIQRRDEDTVADLPIRVPARSFPPKRASRVLPLTLATIGIVAASAVAVVATRLGKGSVTSAAVSAAATGNERPSVVSAASGVAVPSPSAAPSASVAPPSGVAPAASEPAATSMNASAGAPSPRGGPRGPSSLRLASTPPPPGGQSGPTARPREGASAAAPPSPPRPALSASAPRSDEHIFEDRR